MGLLWTTSEHVQVHTMDNTKPDVNLYATSTTREYVEPTQSRERHVCWRHLPNLYIEIKRQLPWL